MLTKGKAADRLQSSVIAVPSRYKIANALMLKGTWLCCVLGGVVFGLPALLVMFSVARTAQGSSLRGGTWLDRALP